MPKGKAFEVYVMPEVRYRWFFTLTTRKRKKSRHVTARKGMLVTCRKLMPVQMTAN